MKKFLLSSLALLLWVGNGLFAQSLTLTIEEPGTSEDIFAQHSTSKDLILKGRINHLDLMLLNSSLRSLEKLDLSEVVIEGYSDEDTYIDYPEGEFTAALAYHKSLKHITLPTSLSSIAEKALFNCKQLESITIPGDKMPKVPNKQLVSKDLYATVTLFVPKNLVEQYKASSSAFWKFSKIEAIPEIPSVPFSGLEFEDIYGMNYNILTEKDYPAIWVAYFKNNSNEIINDIQLSYWFDDDTTNIKTVELNEVQIMPGSEMQDGEGACFIKFPSDTQPHLLYVTPSRVNYTEVNHMGVRVKPIRSYWGGEKRAVRTHLLEIFPSFSTPDDQAKYKSLISAISQIQTKTKMPNKFEIVTYQDLASGHVPLAIEQDLHTKYLISDFRIMLNRALMTPYGTLNNSEELLHRDRYTPAMKVGDEVNVYNYLISRAFHNPGFVFLSPLIIRTKGGEYQAKVSAKMSENEDFTKDFRLHVYIVENKQLPPMDPETEMVDVPDMTTYGNIVSYISPSGGYKLSVDAEGNFTFQTEPFTLSDFSEDKYKLLTFVTREEEKIRAYASILQTASVVINEKNLLESSEKIEDYTAKTPQIYVIENRLFCSDEDWSILSIYNTGGMKFSASQTLHQGVYIVILQDQSGKQYRCKVIVK